MNDCNYTVYAHKFPNNKYYVGLTKLHPERRWGSVGNGYKKNDYLWNEICKFGWENIEHIIIASGLSKEEARILERKKIEEFDCIKNGYNQNKGGGTGTKGSGKTYDFKDSKYTAEELILMSSVKGLTTHNITTRVNHHGWSVEKAITKKKQNKFRKWEYHGKLLDVNGIIGEAKLNDIELTQSAVFYRLKNGWSIDEIVNSPMNSRKKINRESLIKKSNTLYDLNGKKYLLTELLELSDVEGMTLSTLSNRLNHLRWDAYEAIHRPLKAPSMYKYGNKYYTINELCKISPCKNTYSCIKTRLENGWDIERAINVPSKRVKHTSIRSQANEHL